VASIVVSRQRNFAFLIGFVRVFGLALFLESRHN
jgi:hypothetical protein